MNFYGNDISSSIEGNSFQFDKFFPNKYIMDLSTNIDEIFVNRIVLVHYDLNPLKVLPKIIKDNNGKWFIDNENDPIEITTDNFVCGWSGDQEESIKFYSNQKKNDERVIEEDSRLNNCWQAERLSVLEKKKLVIQGKNYLIDSNTSEDEWTKWAEQINWKEIKDILNKQEDFNFDNFKNLEPDQKNDILKQYEQYLNQRDKYYFFNAAVDGEDFNATVWQKTYLNNIETYLMIAKLNAETPSITLEKLKLNQDGSPTAPTLTVKNSLEYVLGVAPTYGIQEGEINFGEKYFHIDCKDSGDDLGEINEISFKLEESSQNPADEDYDENYKDIYVFKANLPGLGKIAKTGWDLLYGENRNTIAFTPPTENNETPDNSKMNRNLSSLLGSLNTYMEKVANFENDASLTNLQNNIINLQKYVGNYDAPEGEDYVDENSLKLQIQNNDLDISLLQDQITNNDLDIENLQGQIDNNDSDITNLQKYVGNYNPFEGEDYIDENSLYKQIINNDLDITNLQKYVGNYNPFEGEDYTDTDSLNKQIEDANKTINILKNNINTLIEYIEKINTFLSNGHFLFSSGRNPELKNFSIEGLPALKKWPKEIQGQNQETEQN